MMYSGISRPGGGRLFLVFSLLAAFFVPGQTAAQETIRESYERIFIRSSLSAKVNVLSDAATDEAAGEFYGPLCELALRFVLDNASLFRDDPDMLSVTLSAVKGLGQYRYGAGAETLWQVFLRFPDNVIRYEILKTLPALEKPELAEHLETFLAEQNRRYGAGAGTDPRLLMTVMETLAALENESSYPALFASTLIYSGELEAAARDALYRIPGDLSAFCSALILNNPPEEKLEAFRLAMNRPGITAGEQGLLAETALEAVMAAPGGAQGRSGRFQELGNLSLRWIREGGWIRALPLVLKYYNRALQAFRSDPSRRDELGAAIATLSALRDSEAARALSFQLGIYNGRAASLSAEEQEMVLALILALGGLSYKASYDVLYQAGELPYPEPIRAAAVEALGSLRW